VCQCERHAVYSSASVCDSVCGNVCQCGSAAVRQSVWQCVQQCAAVRQGGSATVQQCNSSVCAAVRHCTAMCGNAAVCGSAAVCGNAVVRQKCVAVQAAVLCGTASSSVRQCCIERQYPAVVRGSVRHCVTAVCGSVRGSVYLFYYVWLNNSI
jgi:hypothetical protein